MKKQETHYHTIASKITNATEGNLFGKPCYKIGGKAFCCFFEESMVFKLTGESHTTALGLKGAELFDPSKKKRPMKEWVQVPFSSKSQWQVLAHSAAEYVDGK